MTNFLLYITALVIISFLLMAWAGWVLTKMGYI